MTETASPLLVQPYRWDQGNRDKNTTLLNFLVAHPAWMSMPLDDFGRRVQFGMILTDPRNRLWEVWDGENLVGVLYLGDIAPGVSATVHFVFLDRKLVGKRRVLLAWFGECFREWDLQRLGFLVPVNVDPLLHYARTKLGFRFEGERVVEGHPALTHLGMENPHVWVAKQGSRRERAHWDAEKQVWQDVYTLRLLREEYEAREAPPMP